MSAGAIHMNNGDQHIVGVKSLTVLLSKDDDGWFAQGLEIDYASAGESLDEVKKNFELGLEKTIAEHLKLNGSIEKLLKVAPQYAWDEYHAAKFSDLKRSFSTLQFHDLRIDGVQFLEPLAA